jgi:hypothetical protein
LEKRISFQGVDSGVTSMMEKMRQSSKNLGADMISDARKYSQQSKDQLGFIEDQIKAIEKRNRLERESQEITARQSLKGNALATKLGAISTMSSQDDMQTKLLRELIDTIKLTSKEEIAEDRKSVESTLKRFSSDPSQFTPEEQLKAAYQQELLAPKGKGKGIMGDVFAGTFLANALQGVLSNLANFAGAKDEEQAIGSLLGGIPVVGGILGASYGRAREEQYQYDISSSRLRGLTGRGVSTLGSFNRFGYSGTEAAGMMEGYYSAAGTSNINTSNILASGRAFSLDQGAIQDRLRVGRFSQGGQGGFLDEMTRILKASGLEEDRVLFGEILKNQTQLVNEFSQSAEVVNQGIATGAIMAFDKVGGGFSMSDPRSIQRISQINQALSRPSNDIMQAENIALLRRSNPNAGMFDILKMQEQGIQNPELIKGVLGNISDRYGDNSQYAMLALQKRLGLSFSATEQLYKNRGAIMSGSMTSEDIVGMTGEQVSKEAQLSTAKLDVSAAAISDAFVNNVGAGLLEVATQVGGSIGESFMRTLKLAGVEFDNPTPPKPENKRPMLDFGGL